jgi:hypothetical protein
MTDYTDHSELLKAGAPHRYPVYVYRFSDAHGTAVYIGYSNDPGRRASQHRSSAHWWPDAVSLEWAAFPTLDQAKAEESRQIHEHHPAGNAMCPVCPHYYVARQVAANASHQHFDWPNCHCWSCMSKAERSVCKCRRCDPGDAAA